MTDDRGGIKYQVQYSKIGSNLHAVWDSKMIQTEAIGRDNAGLYADNP
jgi:hypothetical protein